MRRLPFFLVASLVLAAPGLASAQQSFNLFIGGFTPRSMDGRSTDDVLFQDQADLQATLNRDNGIDVGQFNGATIGGEYLVGLGRHAEAGLGIGFYQRSVTTSYTDLVHQDGSDIEQDLKLRLVPFSATIRFLPLSNDSPIQPYVGAGVGVFAWRYSETGEFLDRSTNNIFADTIAASGTEVGPLVLGGVRIPIGALGVGGEIRWQRAKANLPANQFLGSTIDLGGVNYLLTLNFRF
jgi:hypothetical protein